VFCIENKSSRWIRPNKCGAISTPSCYQLEIRCIFDLGCFLLGLAPSPHWHLDVFLAVSAVGLLLVVHFLGLCGSDFLFLAPYSFALVVSCLVCVVNLGPFLWEKDCHVGGSFEHKIWRRCVVCEEEKNPIVESWTTSQRVTQATMNSREAFPTTTHTKQQKTITLSSLMHVVFHALLYVLSPLIQAVRFKTKDIVMIDISLLINIVLEHFEAKESDNPEREGPEKDLLSDDCWIRHCPSNLLTETARMIPKRRMPPLSAKCS